MSGDHDDRVYSVIEYLANQEQTQGKVVRIHGPMIGNSENNCVIGNWTEGARFDSVDLPEADRVAILETVDEGRPVVGVLTLDTRTNKAVAVKFD